MSNVNIRRAVENIRAVTTVYTPVVELIVNAIQAIDENDQEEGTISVRALRSRQRELDGGLPDIVGFSIQDNGVGFTDAHRNSFDTLYTDHRIAEGGKGFGRFICLKYFDDLSVKSIYFDKLYHKCRRFTMGKEHDIIVGEDISESTDTETGAVVTLSNLKAGRRYEKKLSTVAGNLVERLLPYFITTDYVCPEIILFEHDGSDSIRLNDFVDNEVSASIREILINPNSFLLSASPPRGGVHSTHFQAILA